MGSKDNKAIGGLHNRHVKWSVSTTVFPYYLAKLTSGTAHLLTKHYCTVGSMKIRHRLGQRQSYGETPLASFTRQLAKR